VVAAGRPGGDQQVAGPARFRPASQAELAPSGSAARVRANLDALTVLRAVERESRPANPGEQARLARWSGWGAVPEVFDPARDGYGWARERLAALVSASELAAAERNTLNAHYTDAALVQAIWDGVGRLGFDGGRVLEPGCGSGNFLRFAPPGAELVGIEVEPVTAAITRALYPDAQVFTESFADTRAREGSFDLVVGNVPFGRITLHDPKHNRAGYSTGRTGIFEVPECLLSALAARGVVRPLSLRLCGESGHAGSLQAKDSGEHGGWDVAGELVDGSEAHPTGPGFRSG